MKTMVNIFLLTFLVFWLDDRLTSSDRDEIRTGLRQLFNDTGDIRAADLPRFRSTVNTNITGRLLVVHEANLVMLKVNMANVTVAKFNDWKAAHLSNTNYMRVARYEDWQTATNDFKLELITGAKP